MWLSTRGIKSFRQDVSLLFLMIWSGILVAKALSFPLHPPPCRETAQRQHHQSAIRKEPLLPALLVATLRRKNAPGSTCQSHRIRISFMSRFWTSARQEQTEGRPTNQDYLVVDSLHLPDDERPSLLTVLNNPRDILALILITVAAGVSVCNILGRYSSIYSTLEFASVILGLLSGLAGLLQAATGYKINRPTDSSIGGKRRRGLADDANVNIYAGIYTLTVSWLALRTSTFCPEWVISLDSFLPRLAIGVFLLAAMVPAVTLFNPGKILDDAPPLSETELLRMRGLLAIGILASIFGPDCLAFASGGREWWDRVSVLHPSQQILESSTSLFALYANEASMISHRCGRAGVAPFKTIVPSFAAVCFLLAVLPCIAALYWLGNDVSFFSFYGE